MKVCLGVRESLLKEGWKSVDLLGNPDIKGDAFQPPIPDGSCSDILASHVLEHHGFSGRGEDRVQQAVEVLRVWASKLESSGRLIVCVPNGGLIAKIILDQPDNYWKLAGTPYVDILGPLFGAGYDFTNHHHMVFTESCLKYCLEQAGFSGVQRIPDTSIPLPQFNGSSQDLRSLNVEARK